MIIIEKNILSIYIYTHICIANGSVSSSSVLKSKHMDKFYQMLQTNDKRKGRKDFDREKIQKYINILKNDETDNDDDEKKNTFTLLR